MRDKWVGGAALAAGAVALVAVHLALLHTYWDYSEGVYALSAHQLLHGADLYGQMVGAQPPGVFLAGAAIEALHGGVEWLRFGVACLQLIAGLFAARMVWRMGGGRIATILTPALMLLTPWAVHEHGALTPELVSLPFMLGAALCAAEPDRALLTGVLAGVLVLIKFPFAIPAVALVALSGRVRRAAPAAAVTLVAGLGVSWAAGGAGFWRDTVLAQLHSGSRPLSGIVGYWAQSGWNVLGLLACAAITLWMHRRVADRRMLTVATALAIANLITFLTNFKQGTGLNITVPVEASLVPLAATGAGLAAAGVRRARRPDHGGARPPWAAVVCSVALAFTLAQSISLVTSPGNAIPFLRAFSAPAWGITLTGSQFEANVTAARACPRGQPYGGPPLIALAAGRILPAGQPDEFLPSHSATLAAVNARIDAVHPVCPGIPVKVP